MKKLFVNLIALLAVADNAVFDEPKDVTLTDDQLQSIENALAAGKANEQIVKDVEGILDGVSDNIKQMDGLKNKVLALANLVNRFPVQAPAGNKAPEGVSDSKQGAIDESAKDGINAEARNLYHPKK